MIAMAMPHLNKAGPGGMGGGFDFAGGFGDIFEEMFGEILGGGASSSATTSAARFRFTL